MIAAVAVVAVAIAISSGGSKSTGLAKGTAATKNTAAVSQLLKGIPQSGARLGNPKAPVTMSYYGDLQCPICQQFTLQGGFSPLVANEVRAGKVQIVYRSLQTATRDPATFSTQQVAALAAGQQQKAWNYIELFYNQQGAEGSGYVTGSYLDALARQIPGLHIAAWNTARGNAALATQIQSEGQQAAAQGFNSTPTLVFQGPKGKLQPPDAVPPYAELQSAIKQVG